jgi:hypothetical protein
MPALTVIAANPKDYKTRTNVIVYGGPKSGKGQAVAELSKKFKLIWFDIENGWEILLKLPPEQQANVTLIKIPDTQGWPIAIETIMKVVTGAKCKICCAHGKVDCPVCAKETGAVFDTVDLSTAGADTIVVIDTLTQLTESAMFHVCSGKPATYKMQLDDYGNIGKLLSCVLSYVQQARFHSVCTAHESEVTLEDGKVKRVPKIGTSNYAGNVAGRFSHVIHVETKNGEHIGHSASTASSQFVTGSRTDVKIESQGKNYTLMDIFAPYLDTEKNPA